MEPAFKRITVAIGDRVFTSSDRGATWNEGPRSPSTREPVAPASALPPVGESKKSRTHCGHVRFLDDGFGVATTFEIFAESLNDGRHSAGLGHVFLTSDSGHSWSEISLGDALCKKHLDAMGCSWPAESYSDLILLPPDGVVLAWEDPWLYDWPDFHVIHSRDRGRSWGYACLGEPCPVLVADLEGRLLAINRRYSLESFDGGATWTRFKHHVAWPEGCPHKKINLLRKVRFMAPGKALALVVHWPQKDAPAGAPDVGLVETCDKGRTWRHLHVFTNTDEESVNSAGVLLLEVD